jgi:hypothetical protein
MAAKKKQAGKKKDKVVSFNFGANKKPRKSTEASRERSREFFRSRGYDYPGGS